MDVVEAKGSDWKYPPFKFRKESSWYLGRGSNDNKAGLTGILLALQYLRADGFRGQIPIWMEMIRRVAGGTAMSNYMNAQS